MTSPEKVVDIYASFPVQLPSDPTPNAIEDLVTSTLSTTNDPKAIYANRVRGKHILLENPVKDSRVKKEREEAKKKRKEERRKRERNEHGGRDARLFRLDPSQAKFHLFLPLHHLWLGYMSELLNLSNEDKNNVPNSASMHPKLVKADFHGSIITVRQSRNSSLVGLTGIVIYETANAFRVVTGEDNVKLLPKAGAVFAFSVPAHAFSPPANILAGTSMPSTSQPPSSTAPSTTVEDIPRLEFELYGNQFLFRSADRTAKKFKPKETIAI